MFTVSEVYGVGPQAPAYSAPAAPTQGMATDTVKAGWRALVDPHNPLFWFGAFLLVTVGAAGAAGSVRLGRARIAAAVGD